MMGKKYNVHWISWHSTPYNDFLFSALSKDPDLKLTVHFKRQVLSTHPWKSGVSAGFDSNTYNLFMGIDWRFLYEAIRSRDRIFVVAGWDDLNTFVVINLLSLLGRPFIIWTDTPDMRDRGFIKGRVRAAWLRWVFGRAMRVMSTGEPGVEALLQMGCSKDKTTNFPFFVDLDYYRRRDGHTNLNKSGTIKFISAGRLLNRIKAHDVAISALNKARSMTGLSNFIYYIAGTGPDLIALERQVECLGLQENVKFLGWVESAKLREYFQDCDVLIHPSLSDPFPNAVLEAMASGMAVLGSDACGSVRDRIRDRENGMIHRAGDVEELALHVSRVLTHPLAIKQMGVAARQTAEAWPASRAVQILKTIMECTA